MVSASVLRPSGEAKIRWRSSSRSKMACHLMISPERSPRYIVHMFMFIFMGPEVEQKRWREDKRILQNSPTHRKKSSTKQQTHRQCLTVRRQTSSSCSTHILQHTLSMSEGMSFDERHGQGSQCSACMYKTKDERIFSLSF